MSPVLVNPSRFSGDPSAAYKAVVLADSPWAALLDRRISSGIDGVDSSGNGNNFTRSDGGYIRKLALGGRGLSAFPGGELKRTTTPAGISGANASVSFWVDVPSGGAAGVFYAFGDGTNGITVGIGSGANFTSNGFILTILRGNIAFTSTGYSFTVGRHHVLITRGASNNFNVYVDGNSTPVYSSSLSSNAPSSDMHVGGGLNYPAAIHRISFFSSVLSSSRASAHYNSGVPSDAPMLADSPVIFLRLDDLGQAWDDFSNNIRTCAFFGLAGSEITGPSGAIPAVSFANGVAGYALGGELTAQPTVVTYEAWVRISAFPSSTTTIMGFSTSSNLYGATSGLSIDASGKIISALYPHPSLVSPSPLPLNTWQHIVASIGAAGAKLRINKITVASSADTSVAQYVDCNMYLRSGGLYFPGGTSGIDIAAPIFSKIQLSDAQTDAHYDAV